MLSPVSMGQYQAQSAQVPSQQAQAQQAAVNAAQTDPSTVRAAQGPEELQPESREPAPPPAESGRGRNVDISV